MTFANCSVVSYASNFQLSKLPNLQMACNLQIVCNLFWHRSNTLQDSRHGGGRLLPAACHRCTFSQATALTEHMLNLGAKLCVAGGAAVSQVSFAIMQLNFPCVSIRQEMQAPASFHPRPEELKSLQAWHSHHCFAVLFKGLGGPQLEGVTTSAGTS